MCHRHPPLIMLHRITLQSQAQEDGGIGMIRYPMIADKTHEIARKYGVLLEDQGVALRGLFIIDKEGIVRHALVNDLPLGRSVEEAIRVVDALQYVEKHGEVCPAGFHEGDEGMKADHAGVSAYLAKHK
eukprot:JZ551143.1.p2 GENE.JZ551143.1~~JZ551143.1.p2  ORF type:complete len:129 (+),score=51.97 JZ551143.1:246-632(+)